MISFEFDGLRFDGIERVANDYGEATSRESETDESSVEQPFVD
jgi:hypothetical protein